MKSIIFYAIVVISFYGHAQNKYFTNTGVVNFEASVASFEEVKASNNAVSVIIDTKNGGLAALVLIKGFRFKNALMEEHFNENYAESDKFPKAIFKGVFDNFDFKKLSGNSSLILNGELTFHGITKSIQNVELKVTKEAQWIKVTGNFIVLASDFNIKIPKLVKDKVSETVSVFVNFKLQAKD